MLNMQSANAAGPAATMAPQETLGNDKQGDGLMSSKTNSETIAHFDTNHEGIIVSITNILFLKAITFPFMSE